jgi:hypothetical protein
MTPATASGPVLPRICRFLRRPWRDRGLLFQAFIFLGLARLAINTMKFETLVTRLGASGFETPAEAPLAHLDEARRIAWAVRSASRYTPWKSNCFPQAIAAKFLLRQRGIRTTLYLGAAFKARTELEAHAWLRCGPLYVTGGPGHNHFGTLGIFG